MINLEEDKTIKPLDFVMTPKGAFAIVDEVNLHTSGNKYSLEFIGPSAGEKSAWWSDSDGLVVIDSLPSVLARTMLHPFGMGKSATQKYFPKPETMIWPDE